MIDQQAAILDNALNMVEAALSSPPKASRSRVCFQTVHYHIVDHGADWKGRWINRFVLERKPEYRRSHVMENHAASDQSAEVLIDAMDAAEKFHLENLPHCGGF
jgi:hypothetical protein